MKKLLLLHYNADCNTNDIWKAAIQSGWATERVHDDNIPERSINFDYVRYYGNTLQAERCKDKFPFKFYPLNAVLHKCDFIGREIRLAKFSELYMPFTEVVFVKPVYQKYFTAKIYNRGETIDAAQLPNDDIYIQRPVEIIDEIRCFCLDGEILTSSYYKKDKEYNPENTDSIVKNIGLHHMVKGLNKQGFLPKAVVLDFGLTPDRGWIFIEPNEAWASGLYGCDPRKCLEVIENSQYRKL